MPSFQTVTDLRVLCYCHIELGYYGVAVTTVLGVPVYRYCDVGSGHGTLLQYLARHLGPNAAAENVFGHWIFDVAGTAQARPLARPRVEIVTISGVRRD